MVTFSESSSSSSSSTHNQLHADQPPFIPSAFFNHMPHVIPHFNLIPPLFHTYLPPTPVNHPQPPPNFNHPHQNVNQPHPNSNQPPPDSNQPPNEFNQSPPQFNHPPSNSDYTPPQPPPQFNQPPPQFNQPPTHFNHPPPNFNSPPMARLELRNTEHNTFVGDTNYMSLPGDTAFTAVYERQAEAYGVHPSEILLIHSRHGPILSLLTPHGISDSRDNMVHEMSLQRLSITLGFTPMVVHPKYDMKFLSFMVFAKAVNDGVVYDDGIIRTLYRLHIPKQDDTISLYAPNLKSHPTI